MHPLETSINTPDANCENSYAMHKRTILALKSHWAWIIWKCQGMTTMNEIIAELTNTEQEHGGAHVALSRVQRFSDIGIKDGINKNRLCIKVRNHKKLHKCILEEKRLNALAEQTLKKYFLLD